jgi:hypothetical protein
MKTVRYRTIVDDDVQYSDEDFRRDIAIYLNDPDGWASIYTFVYASSGPAKCIHLSTPNTLRKVGCEKGSLSCALLAGDTIWLNVNRWVYGADASKLPLIEYRQYMVTHEMGHALGYDHVSCSGPGARAPIMLQQTLGIGECIPNTKVTEIDRLSKQ